MAGKDVIAQAQTGTGKTAAFAIPLVEAIDVSSHVVQAIVVLPTRELAIQVAEAVHAMGRSRNISVLPLYGGQAYDRQLRALRAGVQIVVGTPGRMMDHVRRGTLKLDAVRTVVLDEADEMLDMGFLEDIEFILDQVPAERQIALFSATMPTRIEGLARRYLRDPERVTIAQETRTAPQTAQYFYQVPYPRKVEVLSLILDFESPQSAIIFCRTARSGFAHRSPGSRGYAAAITATSTRRCANSSSAPSAMAAPNSWWRRMWRPAGSTSRMFHTSLTTTSRMTPTPTCTA
jgi:ATP-dependent RNA helicase DeaD